MDKSRFLKISFLCINLLSFSLLFSADKPGIGSIYFRLEGNKGKSCYDCHCLTSKHEKKIPIISSKDSVSSFMVDMKNPDYINHIQKECGNLTYEEQKLIADYINMLKSEFHKALEQKSNKSSLDPDLIRNLKAHGYLDSYDIEKQKTKTDQPPVAKISYNALKLKKFTTPDIILINEPLSSIGKALKAKPKNLCGIAIPEQKYFSGKYILNLNFILQKPIDGKIFMIKISPTKKINKGSENVWELLNIDKSKTIETVHLPFELNVSDSVEVVVQFFTGIEMLIFDLNIIREK